MAADLIIRAGPFFGTSAEPDVVRLQKQMEDHYGCPFVRVHRHGSWLICEGWRLKPLYPEAMPSAEFVEALIAGELPNWVSSDGYRVPEAPSAEDRQAVDP